MMAVSGCQAIWFALDNVAAEVETGMNVVLGQTTLAPLL